ncbi:MAG: matrixin family metalloprotease [Planctomycetota bacterium]
MQLARLIAPCAVTALTVVLLAPAETRAFVIFGDALDLTQRDFRIFNSFTAPSANSNQVPDPDFPGSVGAELAIRKGVAEWGSRPHGSGLTDRTQDLLGSGGSNFDAFYAGRALAMGGPNRNIVSAISGGLAFAITDIPIGDGWRIRFFDGAGTWNDDPRGILTGPFPADIQGVMTHEFGHALGLDHSLVPGATMQEQQVNAGIEFRSIEDDDRAGVNFIYGAISPRKPTIDTYELPSPGVVRIVGERFDATQNDVWFTPADPMVPGDGTPIIVSAVSSVPGSGGTVIEIPVPADAGPGDIAVRIPGIRPDALSNVFPFDPIREPWTPPEHYGTPGTSSAGTPVELEWDSIPSLTAGGVWLEVQGGGVGGFGMVVEGAARGASSTGYGTLLLGGSLRRAEMFPLFLGIGQAWVPFDGGAFVGARRTYQVWIPDGGPAGGVFSDAIEVEIVP